MRQQFFFNLNFAEIPKVIVSVKVWNTQVTLLQELWWKEKNVNDRTQILKIWQVLN